MTIVHQVAASRDEDIYQNYLRAREAVKAMRELPSDRAPEFARLSPHHEEFGRFFDASPATIGQLRRHGHRLTALGIDPYRYDNETEERSLFENKLKALRSLDKADLFVPESRALGGFGYELSAGLANLETLMLYECLIAADRGGALAGLRGLPERQIVLDVSPGGGGLAFALK